MNDSEAVVFDPRTEAWIRKAVEEYEQGLRRVIRARKFDPTEFTGGD